MYNDCDKADINTTDDMDAMRHLGKKYRSKMLVYEKVLEDIWKYGKSGQWNGYYCGAIAEKIVNLHGEDMEEMEK